MFAFIKKLSSPTQAQAAWVINNGSHVLRVGVNLEKGGPYRDTLAGSEQLVSCPDNEDNNCEDLTGWSSTQGGSHG